jgi:hypothetical protein
MIKYYFGLVLIQPSKNCVFKRLQAARLQVN